MFFPAVLFADHRDHNVAAPKGERTDEQIGPEEPEAYFYFFSGHAA